MSTRLILFCDDKKNSMGRDGERSEKLDDATRAVPRLLLIGACPFERLLHLIVGDCDMEHLRVMQLVKDSDLRVVGGVAAMMRMPGQILSFGRHVLLSVLRTHFVWRDSAQRIVKSVYESHIHRCFLRS